MTGAGGTSDKTRRVFPRPVPAGCGDQLLVAEGTR
jgi:hypothetical protein